jgi:hypothetical protein
LKAATIWQVAPSQLTLVLAGPDIASIDPHGYLRRARASISALLTQVTDERAQRLRDLDSLIEDTLAFDRMDRATT